MSGESASLPSLAANFPLPWSASVRLLSIKNDLARRFYETEALRMVRAPTGRQVNSQFYERIALSRNKTAMLRQAELPAQNDVVTREQALDARRIEVTAGHEA